MEENGDSAKDYICTTTVFDEDEVCRLTSENKYVYGLVLECSEYLSSDESDDETPGRLHRGTVRVAWHPDGKETVVDESKVLLADRSLMPGDVVRRMIKNSQRGFVQDLDIKCHLHIRGIDKYIYNVDAKDLLPPQEYDPEPGEVTMDSWVGRIELINEDYRVSFPDGAVCTIPDQDITELEDAEEKREKHSQFAVRDFYYKGQILKGTLEDLSHVDAKWINSTANFNSKAVQSNSSSKHTIQARIDEVTVKSLDVHWLCRGFAKVDNPHVKMESPKRHVEASDLHRIQVLDLFQHCNKQIGDKGFYVIKESDILHDTPPKKSYIPDIVSYRKSVHHTVSPKSVSKLKSPKIVNSEQISENELISKEDLKNLKQNIDNTSKLNGDIDNNQPTMDISEKLSETENGTKVENESIAESVVGGNTPDSSDVAVSKSDSVDDEEFEDIDQESDKDSECSSASSYSGYTDSNKKRRKSNKKGPALKTKQMKKIKGRKSTKYFKFEEKELECKPGDKVPIEIAYTYSTACVLWQNGEIENDIPSPELFPIHHLDELEFFPGDYVVDSNEDSAHDYGVVMCCDHQSRTCMVKWMKTVDISKGEKPDESVEPEEVSVYDIKDHPDFKFRPGQTVIRVGEPENVTDDTPAVGQVQKLDPQGAIYIKWPGITEPSKCYPQELYIVGDEMSEFDSSSNSSEWSTQEEEEYSDSNEEWETETEEEMDEDKSDNEDEDSDSEVKAKSSDVEKLLHLGKSKTEELDALLERAKTALQKLEEIFQISQDFSRETCYRDILTIYRKCRDLEKILKSSYLEDSDIVDLIEEVKLELRKEKAKKINKHLLEVFESRKNQGQKSKVGETNTEINENSSTKDLDDTKTLKLYWVELVNGDISPSHTNSGKVCLDSETSKTDLDSTVNKDLCLRVYKKLHERLMKVQQVMDRNWQKNNEKSSSNHQMDRDVAEKSHPQKDSDINGVESTNQMCNHETECLGAEGGYSEVEDRISHGGFDGCEDDKYGYKDVRKDNVNGDVRLTEAAAGDRVDPFFHLLEEVLSSHKVRSEDRETTSTTINNNELPLSKEDCNMESGEERTMDNCDQKKDLELQEKSSDVSKLMLMGKAKKAELDGFLHRTQTALQKLEQIFKILDANLQSSFYENCYEDIINIYHKCHDIEKILKSSYLEDSEIVDLIEDVKRELGKEKRRKIKKSSSESRRSHEQKSDVSDISNDLENVHLSGKKGSVDEGKDGEICKGDKSDDQNVEKTCSGVKSPKKQSSVDKDLCLSICKQLNLCMNKIQQEMNKRWQKAEKARLSHSNDENTSTNVSDKKDDSSSPQTSSETSSEPVCSIGASDEDKLTESCKTDIVIHSPEDGDSKTKDEGMEIDEDKSQADIKSNGDVTSDEMKVLEASAVDNQTRSSCTGFHLLEEVPLNHRFLSESQTSDKKSFMSAVMKELKLLQTSLPEGIVVKGYEDRMDLYSVMIVGPAKTPYEDGLFFFEVHLPTDYPGNPPNFHYLSYCSDRLNPNLYDDGKVCVSLLGTWGGKGNEMWTQNSNLLQVLVSIQGLILVDEPYYNEAGYEKQRGTQQGHENSKMYNEMAILKMIESLTQMIKNPPSVFKDEVNEYSKKKWPSLIRRLEHWIFNSSHLPEGINQNKTANELSMKGNDHTGDSKPDDIQEKPESSAAKAATLNNRVDMSDSNRDLDAVNLEEFHDKPEFPLLPPSKGFCLTLKKHLERFKKTLPEDLS